jgi:hypothetical protein
LSIPNNLIIIPEVGALKIRVNNTEPAISNIKISLRIGVSY